MRRLIVGCPTDNPRPRHTALLARGQAERAEQIATPGALSGGQADRAERLASSAGKIV
ncbi:hypothetical protein ACQEVF_38105 [Nonomuraea polychroma]|uniref:hypothetical protein n=1 Tax=Nonomuraea polychroma TaxID=46176 RepID=UPI003D8E4DB1